MENFHRKKVKSFFTHNAWGEEESAEQQETLVVPFLPSRSPTLSSMPQKISF
jgi:hypothetical protein